MLYCKNLTNLIILIFHYRLLPDKDLLNAACVSKRWFIVIQGDAKLRYKVRRHFRRLKRAQISTILHGDLTRRTRPHSDRPAMVNTINTPRYQNPSPFGK